MKVVNLKQNGEPFNLAKFDENFDILEGLVIEGEQVATIRLDTKINEASYCLLSFKSIASSAFVSHLESLTNNQNLQSYLISQFQEHKNTFGGER